MKVLIEINCDNDAFGDTLEEEVCGILWTIVEKLKHQNKELSPDILFPFSTLMEIK